MELNSATDERGASLPAARLDSGGKPTRRFSVAPIRRVDAHRPEHLHGVRAELEHEENYDDAYRGDHEGERVHEPGQSGEREVVRAQALVEVLRCEHRHLARAAPELLAVRRPRRRGGADEEPDEVELAQRPGELEERVDEDQDEQEELQLPQLLARADRARQPAERGLHRLGGAKQRHQPAENEHRRRREERRALRERRDQRRVHHPQVAREHLPHPLEAVAAGEQHEPGRTALASLGIPRIAPPARGEDRERSQVERGEKQPHSACAAARRSQSTALSGLIRNGHASTAATAASGQWRANASSTGWMATRTAWIIAMRAVTSPSLYSRPHPGSRP